MEVVQVVIIGIVSTILIVILKKNNAEFGLYIGIAASIVIFFLL